jgi:dTDP-4-dehydrorhamnose reductase
MNILITGANGQLGNEMRALAPNYPDYRFIFTDVAELDITNYTAIVKLMQEEQVDIVVNCAAYTNVDKAEDDEATAFLINATAVEYLAKASQLLGVTLFHVSTDYVFQGDHCLPYQEDEETAPLGVYGRSKLAAEQSILRAGCNYFIFRTAWLYSAYGTNFVKTMRRLTAEKNQLKVVFDQVGSPTYAGDLAAAILQVIANGKSIQEYQGIYHYSNEGVCSWFDFAKEVALLCGNNCDIQPCHSDEFPSKVKRPHFSVLDKSKYKTTFGFTIPYWKDSLEKCIHELTEK